MPYEKDFELINGELPARNGGSLSSGNGGELLFLNKTFLQANPDGGLFTVATLRENEALSGEEVLPGFGCKMSGIFPPPASAYKHPSEALPRV